MKIFVQIIMIGLVLSATSCSDDLSECPSKMCIIAGGWKLREAFIDDVRDNTDLSKYSLTLHIPVPQTNTTSGFDRTQPSGRNDRGSWSVENNGTVLLLVPEHDERFSENWIIESFSPREMILVTHRNTTLKQGPSKIRFVLEPF